MQSLSPWQQDLDWKQQSPPDQKKLVCRSRVICLFELKIKALSLLTIFTKGNFLAKWDKQKGIEKSHLQSVFCTIIKMERMD